MKQKDAFFYRGVCLSRRLKKGEEEEEEEKEKEEEKVCQNVVVVVAFSISISRVEEAGRNRGEFWLEREGGRGGRAIK